MKQNLTEGNKQTEETLCSTKELRSNKKLRGDIPHTFGVYQWWCNKETVEVILNNLKISDYDGLKSNDIESKEINGENYYCIYVGETVDLHRRILSNHISGNIHHSTFRKTIAAVLKKNTEQLVSEQIDEFYISYVKSTKEEYHNKQNSTIAECFRPLNNKDIKNTSANKKIYTPNRGYKPTKNSLKSEKLTELRNELRNEFVETEDEQ